MKKILGIEVYITSQNIRLWMGSLGWITTLICLIMTVLFEKNGTDVHADMIKTFLWASGGLLGLNIIKEGINLNIGNTKHNHEHTDEGCEYKRQNNTCLGQKEGVIERNRND